MSKKKFQTCINCDFRAKCSVGEARLNGILEYTKNINDIGCFDFEIYKELVRTKQLKLFD